MPSAARLGDLHYCADDGPNNEATLTIVNGSPNITINRIARSTGWGYGELPLVRREHHSRRLIKSIFQWQTRC